MSDPEPRSRPRRWRRRWSKYVLPLALTATLATSLVNTWKTWRVGGEVDRRLTVIEETVKKNQRQEAKRLADLINQKSEVVKQIKEKLKSGKLSKSEIRDIISLLRGVLRAMQSILNLGCSFVAEEKKSELQVMLDKMNDELERLSDSPPAEDQGIKEKLVELAKKAQDLIELIKKLCVFTELGSEPGHGFDASSETHDTSGADLLLLGGPDQNHWASHQRESLA